jgi:hypothetical protein
VDDTRRVVALLVVRAPLPDAVLSAAGFAVLLPAAAGFAVFLRAAAGLAVLLRAAADFAVLLPAAAGFAVLLRVVVGMKRFPSSSPTADALGESWARLVRVGSVGMGVHDRGDGAVTTSVTSVAPPGASAQLGGAVPAALRFREPMRGGRLPGF